VAIPKTEAFTISRVQVQGHWVWRIESAGHTELKSSPLLTISGSGLNAEAKDLPAQLLLSANKGKFDVIGILPLEDYLVGVLASEMPLSWPAESLKAQAIAARSYTLATLEERKNQLFQVESDIQDQVFRHILHGVEHHALVEKAFQAVKETEGMILTSPKSNRVLKAYYHADCGGKTSSAKQVWGYGEKQGSVVDETCPSNPKASWSLALGAEALKTKLAQALPKPESISSSLVASRLMGLELLRASPRDRVDIVKLKFENGTSQNILADKFRAALGYGNLKSTHFEVSETASQNEKLFNFRGRGFGHGVGLCQWGSRMMALQKHSADEILKHYYPQAQILKPY
jgi:stage II sporulation protein D